MNYELAKKLKDAGFPQERKYISAGWIGDYYKDRETGERIYIPTLSKLIEACGDGTVSLRRVSNGWVAADSIDLDNIKYSSFNHTPKKAVANLYLALHT